MITDMMAPFNKRNGPAALFAFSFFFRDRVKKRLDEKRW